MQEIITTPYQGKAVTALKVYLDYDEFESYNERHPNLEMSAIIHELFQKEDYKTIPHLIIGNWGDAYESGIDDILRDLITYKDRFTHLESLFIGDMDSEDCEISWIIQGEYAPLLAHYPHLKSLTIKGATNLSFEKIAHPNLTHFELITGGLSKDILDKVATADLPKLESLRLYFGVEDYGFDGDIDTITALLRTDLFPHVKHLGLLNSELQDDIVTALVQSDILKQLVTLDLSMGTLTDIGGGTLLSHREQLQHLTEITIKYHYLSDEMIKTLQNSGLKVTLSDQQEAEEPDEEYGFSGRYPMYTE